MTFNISHAGRELMLGLFINTLSKPRRFVVLIYKRIHSHASNVDSELQLHWRQRGVDKWAEISSLGRITERKNAHGKYSRDYDLCPNDP